MVRRTRNNCRKEPAKIVPIEAEVLIAKIPENFPIVCQKMVGKTYPAIVHTDSRGKTLYKILKDLVEETLHITIALHKKEKQDPEKISFANRKYIVLQPNYCN